MPLKFPRKSPCDWVGERLPLFAGGELPWTERRKIERHLIVCDRCRTRETSQQRALEVLRTAAGVDPARLSDNNAPFVSLWPGLARQIQDARHSPPPSAFSWEGVTSWLEGTWAGLNETLPGLGRSLAVTSLGLTTFLPQPIPHRTTNQEIARRCMPGVLQARFHARAYVQTR